MTDQYDIHLTILGQSYQILCRPEEEVHLRTIVKTLEEKLLRVKEKYPSSSLEKILMLQTINEMRKVQKLEEQLSKFESHTRSLHAKLDDSLSKGTSR